MPRIRMSTGRLTRYLPRSRAAQALGVATLAGIAIGLIIAPGFPGGPDTDTKPPEVRLLGQPVNLDDNATHSALDRVRRFVAAPLELVLPDGRVRSLPLGKIGVQIDKVRMASLIREAKDRTSPLRRGHKPEDNRAHLTLPVPLVLEPGDGLGTLLRLKDEVDRLPSDARLDLEHRKLVPEVEGLLLDVDATWVSIEQGLSQGERRIPVVVERVRPKRLAKELSNVEFGTVLGSFETRYDRSERAKERTFNLRLAASKLDGHVLLPGETFEFNEVVGPRDEANGYKVATVIAEGELVDGIGGGTCQISGTLHGAVFFAGLSIVTRVPHTRPSSYIKMGLDATVVYPTLDFRFKNPFDYPVVLHETVKEGVVRAEILGPARPHTVTLIRRITEAQPYEEVERPDDRLPRGVRVLGQRGVAGFSVTRYRIVRDGPHATRERWLDRYPPTQQIIRVGTGDMAKDSVKVEDDPHTEYLADELLVMTYGLDDAADEPGARGQPDNLKEWREPGKTGQAGWTKAAGMPWWEATQPAESESSEPTNRKTQPKPAAQSH